METPRTRPLFLGLLLALAPALRAVTIADDFEHYANGATLRGGQTDFGAPGRGWLSVWRTSQSADTTTVAAISAATPLDSGRRYFSVRVQTPAGQPAAAGSLSRAYDTAAVSSGGETPLAIGFTFRADRTNPALCYNLFDSRTRASFPNRGRTSWQLVASDGVWLVGDGPGALAPAGVPFRDNVTYQIVVTVHPDTKTWSVTLSDGTRPVTVGGLGFRSPSWETDDDLPGARWLIFGVSENTPGGAPTTGAAATFSVDAIFIGGPALHP